MPDLSDYRYDGDDRYETQALTAVAQWPDGAPVVYLADAYSYSDIATAQGFKDGPTLLTNGDNLKGDTINAIKTLKPSMIRAIGGGVTDKSLLAALTLIGVTP